MKKISTAWQFWIVMAVFLASCASLPIDTPAKQLAVAEITYQEVLQKATLYKREKRLTAEQAAELTKHFDTIDAALIIARAAIQRGDSPDGSLKMINNALSVVRQILVEAEQ